MTYLTTSRYRLTNVGRQVAALREAAEMIGLSAPAGCTGSHMTAMGTTYIRLQPLLNEIIPEPWTHLTVVVLYPSSQIVAHADPPLDLGVVRYHLPIRSNPGCWSFSVGVWQQLRVGEVYRMNPAEEHGAVNWGTEPRWSVLVDKQEQRRD